MDGGRGRDLLEGGAEDGAAEVGRGLPQGALEAVGPRGEVAALGDDAHLVLVVGHDLGQLELDVLGLLGLAAHAGEHGGGLFELTVDDEEAGRLGEDEETGGQDDGGDQLDGDGDPVRAAVEAVLGGVVDARGDHQPDGDGELVARDDGAPNLAGRHLGHVQDDDGGDEPDTWTARISKRGRMKECIHSSRRTKARDDPADRQHGNGAGGDLDDDAGGEEEAARDDGGAPAEPVGQITRDQGAKEGARRQDRHDERVVRRRDDEAGRGRTRGRVGQVLEGVDEVLHAQDARDVARVVAKEEAAKGGEDAHEVGLDRHGRLDALRVGRRHEDGSSRHDDGGGGGGGGGDGLVMGRGLERGRARWWWARSQEQDGEVEGRGRGRLGDRMAIYLTLHCTRLWPCPRASTETSSQVRCARRVVAKSCRI